MSEIDSIIDGLQSISNKAQLRDLIALAHQADRKRCGSCLWWMRSKDCPMERNVNGWNRGPSAESPICGKFEKVASHDDIVIGKRKVASDFAAAHGLPNPFPMTGAAA